MAAKLETKIAIGALLTALVIAAVCVLSYWSVREADETSRLVAHTYEVLTQLEAALGNLTEAEAGTRGYLLTGENSYLETQEENFANARGALDGLAGFIRGNAVQEARLASLRQKFEQKIAFLIETTQLRHSGDEESARDLFATGRGRQVMDELREIAVAMEGSERGLLEERQRRAAQSVGNTTKIVLIAGMINALVLALAWMTTRQEMHTRRQLEGMLRHDAQELTALNEELEAFSYSVSHDLRAPLRHISGFADLLRQQLGGQLDEKARRYLSVIGESSHHMGVLIDELLAFARVGRAELQRSQVDLAALVQTVIRNLHASVEGRDVEWQIGALPEVQADAGLLRQVWTNLIDNALKYTRARPRAVIEIGSKAQEGELLFYVRDNGVGFDPQYAGKLFGVFQRLHQTEEFEGTGIGLANVRRVIQKHGGRTWAEGQVDAGATFYFTLPLGITGLP